MCESVCQSFNTLLLIKDIDCLIQVLQVPLNGAQAVPQLIGCPVHLLLGGTAPLLQQLAPSVMETLCCIHCLLDFTVNKQTTYEQLMWVMSPFCIEVTLSQSSSFEATIAEII